MVYIKTCELNCLIFASIVYQITVCSCAAVKTCELCYMLYFEKTSDTTLSGSYISPKQHFHNIEDFKVIEEAELFQNY